MVSPILFFLATLLHLELRTWQVFSFHRLILDGRAEVLGFLPFNFHEAEPQWKNSSQQPMITSLLSGAR